MAQKPSIPKGTRDFSPIEVAKRDYIFGIIKQVFQTFGFQPIETPSFENSSTLMGKYGEEGDRLIFKILNSGDYLNKIDDKFYFDLFLINIKINEGYESLVNFIKGKKELINSDDNNLDYFVENDLKEFSFFKNQDFELFNLSRNYILTRLYSIYIATNFSENKDMLPGKITSLVKEVLNSHLHKKNKVVTPQISEKALRYDLTVPFARYVVQHQNDISFPFKRYQIQPVWRADRPQKGRFREFYQCDADVVGSKSLLQEVDFIQLYDTVFSKLGLAGTTIKINNRKILSGIAEVIGAKDKLIDFTVALDKLDKIGKEGVVNEMLSKGVTKDAILKLSPLFSFNGGNEEKLNSLSNMLKSSEEGLLGVKELRSIISKTEKLGLSTAKLVIDVTLARGLNYYTGAIFEVAAPEGVKMGSIGGGGRYDDLTGVFGLPDVSGVGISFGLDRIYLVLEELGLFKSIELPRPKVLFLNCDDFEEEKLIIVKKLRNSGIKCELYPDFASSNKKIKKQWKYATDRNIEFVVSEMLGADKYSLKNMLKLEFKECNLEELLQVVNNS